MLHEMEITKGYYDFCIPYQSNHTKLTSIVNQLKKFGYRTIAIEQVFDHTKKENSTKKSTDMFPEPIDLEFLNEFEPKMKILNRLTIIYSDSAITHPMTTSANLKKYNIVAGLPNNETALNHCCTTFNGDVVCFNTEEGNRLTVQRKAYQVAVKRGIFFELRYSDFILNSSIRRDMIKIAHNYYTRGKLRHIIISSNAKNEFELRNPYDVSNLALIFGLSEDQGKSAVASNCRLLFLKAEARRLGKSVMFGEVLPINGDNSDDDSDSDNSEEEVKPVVEEIKEPAEEKSNFKQTPAESKEFDAGETSNARRKSDSEEKSSDEDSIEDNSNAEDSNEQPNKRKKIN